MGRQVKRSLIPCLCVIAAGSLGTELRAQKAVPGRDPRNFANGLPIPVEGYCDQPRIVVTSDGTWVCVLTTGPGQEGSDGQHVVATTSTDRGKTWSPPVDVEPVAGGKKSSYALALATPFDRVYAFYCYNGDGIRTLPDGRPIRDDMQGWFCYRYSDDRGRSWSKQYRLAMRITAVDRGNDWQGRLQMFWAIGTPASYGRTAIFGFSKLGRYLLQDGEGWFFRSDNVLTERDADKVTWRLLPDGDHGVRAPDLGSVQEEHDVVHLEGDALFCVYRTAQGVAACSYCRDGGVSWDPPAPLTYTPGGRAVKQPRACAKMWKTKDGRYLLWYHNNGTTTYNNGLNAGSRNLAWLAGGRLKDGRLHWSQPEIVAYVDGGLDGCSYPDLIEDGGKYYLCATQKTQARVLAVDATLLQGLWEQPDARTAAKHGLVLDLSGAACASQSTAKAPRLPLLSGQIQGRTLPVYGRGGFTIEVALRFADLDAGQVVVDGRDAAGKGYVLRTTDRSALRLEFSDGSAAAYWDCDAGLLKPDTDHHMTVIVDGGPKAITFAVDGILCDGGKERAFGFGRFSPNLKDANGARTLQIAPALHGRIRHLRIYDRALRTSEAVGNYRANMITEKR